MEYTLYHVIGLINKNKNATQYLICDVQLAAICKTNKSNTLQTFVYIPKVA